MTKKTVKREGSTTGSVAAQRSLDGLLDRSSGVPPQTECQGRVGEYKPPVQYGNNIPPYVRQRRMMNGRH